MAGGSFTNPSAPKGDTTKLIPFSPQQDSINQYLRFNSSAFRTKNGYDYIQKNRTSPQRSYKMRYRLNKTDAYKMESLLFNPELFYLPLWEQKQVYGKKIAIGDTYINNYTTLDTTDMIFWLFKSNLEYHDGKWWAPDYLGMQDGYYLPNSLDADDWVKIEKTTLGDTFSIAFRYKDWALSVTNWRFMTNSGGTAFFINADFGTNHTIRIQSGATNDSFRSVSEIEVSSSSWHDVVITVKVSTQECTMYFDGVASAVTSLGTPFEATSFSYLKLFVGDAGGISAKIKDVLITSDIMSATEAGYFHNETIALIDNKVLWYDGTDASGNLIDRTGNGNTGIVNNITSEFYNPQIADAELQGNRPNTSKNYLNSGSFKLGQTDAVLAVDALFSTPVLNDFIKHSDIVRDYESEHLLFANNDSVKVKDVIAFSSARSALTTPTLEQVLYYDAEDSFTATGYDFVADQWVLVWESPDKYELMEVSSVSGNKITFKAAFTIAFDNPIVIPVFKALLLGNPQWQKTTENDLFDVELDFMLIRNLDFASYTPAETYNSVMVLTDINFYQDKRLGNVLNPEVNITDFGYGALAYYKNYNQSTNVKTFGLKATDRAEIVSMLKFINYLNGMQREIYVPTFQRDFEPLANITDVQTEIQVENKGLTEIADSDGLNRVAMLYLNGDFYYAAITSIVETSATVETVTLTTAFGVAVNIETDDFFICWLFKACLLSDQVDIQYRNKYAYAMLNFRETQA